MQTWTYYNKEHDCISTASVLHVLEEPDTVDYNAIILVSIPTCASMWIDIYNLTF